MLSNTFFVKSSMHLVKKNSNTSYSICERDEEEHLIITPIIIPYSDVIYGGDQIPITFLRFDTNKKNITQSKNTTTYNYT